MNVRTYLTWVVLLGVVGCATPPSGPVDASDSEMLGLGEAPAHPVWEDWAPAPATSLPAETTEPMAAFDYWQLDDPDFVELAWAPVSTLLDSVRRQSPDEAVRDSATLMLEALEPGEEPGVLVDATFYVTERREGVAVRFLRNHHGGGSASVVVLLDRDADGPTSPDRIRLVARPGYEQPSAFSVKLGRDSAGWAATFHSGGTHTDETSGGEIDEARLYADVFTAQLWAPLTGTDYASASRRTGDPQPVPSPFHEALGLEVGDRDIDRVFTNSVFTPRMDGFSPGR